MLNGKEGCDINNFQAIKYKTQAATQSVVYLNVSVSSVQLSVSSVQVSVVMLHACRCSVSKQRRGGCGAVWHLQV